MTKIADVDGGPGSGFFTLKLKRKRLTHRFLQGTVIDISSQVTKFILTAGVELMSHLSFAEVVSIDVISTKACVENIQAIF